MRNLFQILFSCLPPGPQQSHSAYADGHQAHTHTFAPPRSASPRLLHDPSRRICAQLPLLITPILPEVLFFGRFSASGTRVPNTPLSLAHDNLWGNPGMERRAIPREPSSRSILGCPGSRGARSSTVLLVHGGVTNRLTCTFAILCAAFPRPLLSQSLPVRSHPADGLLRRLLHLCFIAIDLTTLHSNLWSAVCHRGYTI